MFTTDQVMLIAKALRDDAAGNKQATMTDLDLAVAALTSLAKERDNLKAALVAQLIQDKRKEQAEQEQSDPEGAWGKIKDSKYLSNRSMNALLNEGYKYLSELEGVESIRSIPNVGRYCEKEIQFAIQQTKKDLGMAQ